MKTGLDARWATCLLATTLLAGCATSPSHRQDAPASPSTFTAFAGKPSMSADELRGLAAQLPAEQRRRLDVVLAAHPGDVAARVLRLEAENDLPDSTAVLTDSETLLENPSLDLHLRLYVLDVRAQALIQLKRHAEAIVVANQALEIDDSNPEALLSRGWARYRSDNGLAEIALADLDRALQLEPDEALAYFRRAIILQHQGKFDLATSNLERARQLAPDYAPIRQQFATLMFAEWYSGQFRQPIAAFREQAASAGANEYAPLWLFIMRIRADPADETAARAELAALAPTHQPHVWTDTLVDLMQGKSNVEAALAEADAAPTYALRAGRRCEADYFAAEQLLMRGPGAEASRLLEEAYWVCPSTYIEAQAVVAEQRLQAARAPAR